MCRRLVTWFSVRFQIGSVHWEAQAHMRRLLATKALTAAVSIED